MNQLGLGHELNISQTLEMMLSPRMIQMLKMLNLSYMDLVAEIEQKSEENVMLEIEKPDRLLEYIKHISSERIPKNVIPGEELPGIETLADTAGTLSDHLLKQLDLEDVEGKKRKIGEELIGSIDKRGYILNYPEVCKNIISELKTSQKIIDEVLETIQTFDPEGVGARDLKECLLIQVREQNFQSPDLEDLLVKVIGNHLEDLANREFDKIAKALKIPRDGVEKLAEFIKNNLNPNPGNMFSDEPRCVVPSFSIKKEKGKYVVVNLEKTYGPILKINSTYEKMLSDPKTDAKTIEFIRVKLQAAKDFLENISKRHETTEKIMNMIVEKQSSFFDDEKTQLHPLMQKDIADVLGLHPSTISRAISNKYIQLPRGIILLKILCPRDVKGLTSENIKKMIEDLIKNEDKRSPLGDDQIAEKLKEQGVNLERRTVAAYRQRSGLEIASKRVKF